MPDTETIGEGFAFLRWVASAWGLAIDSRTFDGLLRNGALMARWRHGSHS